MVAMRSAKAAIAHSMKMRDLINSNSADHSLRRQSSGWGLAASMPSRQSIIQTTRPPRGSVVFTNRNRPGVRLGDQQQGTRTPDPIVLAVHRCTQTPVSRGLLPPPCWFSVCPASSAFLVCKPTEFPSFRICRRLSHESELLGSDPSLSIILAKATKETEATRDQTKACFVGRAGHLHDYPTKGLLYLDLKIGNFRHGWHLSWPPISTLGAGPKLQAFSDNRVAEKAAGDDSAGFLSGSVLKVRGAYAD